MHLQNFEEIVGKLTDITFDKNQDKVTLLFTFQKIIEFPANAIDIQYLQSLVGKKIGILKIDGVFRIKEYQKKDDL